MKNPEFIFEELNLLNKFKIEIKKIITNKGEYNLGVSPRLFVPVINL